MYLLDLEDERFYENARILIFQLIFLRSLALIALLIKANPFTKHNEMKKIRKKSFDSLRPSNSYLPGLSSHCNFKINV
jgi:hypothetical protein